MKREGIEDAAGAGACEHDDEETGGQSAGDGGDAAVDFECGEGGECGPTLVTSVERFWAPNLVTVTENVTVNRTECVEVPYQYTVKVPVYTPVCAPSCGGMVGPVGGMGCNY